MLEKNLDRIARLAEEKDDENWHFRSFLKQIDMTSEELDEIVHKLTAAVSAQIDCTECGNCCHQMRPVLDKDDLVHFATGLSISVQELREKHLIPDPAQRSKYLFNALPCPFLKAKKCTNYEHRPKDCQSYPHLQTEGFVFRLTGAINNYAICPIVFNVYEQLKECLTYGELFDDDWEDFYD